MTAQINNQSVLLKINAEIVYQGKLTKIVGYGITNLQDVFGHIKELTSDGDTSIVYKKFTIITHLEDMVKEFMRIAYKDPEPNTPESLALDNIRSVIEKLNPHIFDELPF